MSWSNIKLIFGRELRDQLRDRRTLFMIAVLPILFYPLLGVSFFQIAQFLKKHESRVLVVGYERTENMPNLIQDEKLSASFTNSEVHIVSLKLTETRFYKNRPELLEEPRLLEKSEKKQLVDELRGIMNREDCEAVLYFPPTFAKEVTELPDALRKFKEDRDKGVTDAIKPTPPGLDVITKADTEGDALTGVRVRNVVVNISQQVRSDAEEALEQIQVDNPVQTTIHSKEGDRERINTALWSKVLPFVLMIWAITGAFYPAVDLCAGEKERGTLETLLSSPAQRSEIVMGKLFTVMLFSVATAMLNLTVMFITGSVLLQQIPQLAQMANVSAPPTMALVWSMLVVIPVSVLISAICLALAALAKSTKEGQHYLAPVMLVALPLTLLPMSPQVELNLPFSLIPVTGIVLLMRSLMEGTIVELWPYAFPVVGVTILSCWLSIRWAIEQFNSESVLFREGERWNLGTWLKSLSRDRQPTPTVALAVLCGLLILMIRVFIQPFLAPDNPNNIQLHEFVQSTVILQLVAIATPALLMAVMLTSSVKRSLSLIKPPALGIPAAIALAVCIAPLSICLLQGINLAFPMREEYVSQLKTIPDLLGQIEPIYAILLMAVLPAICEELAFRGFILSGLRHSGRKWRAIVITSVFFSLSHVLFQQEINAFFIGLIIGYVAIQSGSIWPCIAYHVTHNALNFTYAYDIDKLSREDPLLFWGGMVPAGFLLALAILYYFHRLPYRRTKEEDLQEAIAHGEAQAQSG